MSDLPLDEILIGDAVEKLKELPENSVDSVVTDPPAGITFMGKSWDNYGSLQGFQDFIFVAFSEVFRVLKPGGHGLVWALPRTSHHTAMGLERAGFEIRDVIHHIFGSGFPKSLNIGKSIDKMKKTGNASWNGTGDSSKGALGYSKLQAEQGYRPEDYSNRHNVNYEVNDEEAKKWEGWGTSLKPAVEEWILIRKPLSERNVALNVLKWGVGGLNIDGCRIETNEKIKVSTTPDFRDVGKKVKEVTGIDKLNFGQIENAKRIEYIPSSKGRFPANLVLDEEAGRLLDEQSGISKSNPNPRNRKAKGMWGNLLSNNPEEYSDKGGASRFFYCAKASKKERNAGLSEVGLINVHPTIKPLSLMKYLVRLVTPPGGVVLDPFCGSGSTCIAALQEGFNYIGIEKEEEYVNIARARVDYWRKEKKKEDAQKKLGELNG